MKNIRFTTTILMALVAMVVLTSMTVFGGDPAPATKDYNLSDFGIPVTVTAPEGAEVKKGMINGEIDGQTIYSADIIKGRFIMMVSMWDNEPEEGLEDAIASQKENSEENEGFKGYILEEENGYIFKTVEDGETDYDFIYILEKDDRHIQFSVAFTMKAFTEAEIQVLYAAAKAAH
jgi:hypothetical protein